MANGSYDSVSSGAPDPEPATLRHSGLLAPEREAELDRWTEALRRTTRASAAALTFASPGGVLVKSLATGDAVLEPFELDGAGGFESHLAAAAGNHGRYVFLEASVSAGGRVVGQMCLADRCPREWNEFDRKALEDAAAAASTEVELRLARAEAGRTHDLVASHSRVHDLIASAAPLDEILTEIVTSIEGRDPSVIGCVVLLDRESSTLHPGAGPSLPPHYLAAIDGVVIGPNVGACGCAAWSGTLTISADIGTDPKWAPVRDFVLGVGLQHCWSMPIKGPDGEVLGTLALYGAAPRQPLPEHLSLLEDWARVAGIAIERHRSLQQLLHDARHDGLTGLPNRSAIFERLEESIARVRRDAQAALLFVDLDGLKGLNDSLGHDRADEMIREIGNRLAGAVRSDDFVGRFGGDEFVVIAERVGGQEDAAELGLRLLDAISDPLPGLDSTVVTASIGIALLSSRRVEGREAIRQADSAMYAAKRSGRDRCAFFEGSQRIRTGRRLLLARELRGAELRGELHLVFQPVFELSTSDVVGVEALLRWSSPTFGDVSPVEFIPIAEDTGSIVPIGAWVLRESSETIAAISGRLGRPIELSVNVSAHQVANPGFALSVQQTLAHAELPAHAVRLEITETALMRPSTATDRTLRELVALGARVVLDDFGTGFSSLSWLKSHPLGAIKIDRSFVAGLPDGGPDHAIVGALIRMAQALGCTVTAEGVETEEQLAILRELGCDRVQGFLLARPMSAEALVAFLGLGRDVRAA